MSDPEALEYAETLRSPLWVSLGLGCLASAAFWIAVDYLLTGEVTRLPPPGPILILAAPASLVVFLVLKVWIRVQGQVLTVRGPGRRERIRIPLGSILSCDFDDQGREWVPSLRPAWLRFPTAPRPQDGRAIQLPGYRGGHLVLEYRREAPFSGARSVERLHVPSRNGRELAARLRTRVPPGRTEVS